MSFERHNNNAGGSNAGGHISSQCNTVEFTIFNNLFSSTILFLIIINYFTKEKYWLKYFDKTMNYKKWQLILIFFNLSYK